MGLKGSKTEQNLKDAFAGESQANRRYLYFANKADVEGQNDVAALFRSTAEGETGHAFGHFDFLAEVGDPPPGAADGDGFVVTVNMTSLAGCSGEAFASVLRSLGYVPEQRKGPAITVAIVKAAPTQPVAPAEPGVEQGVEAIAVSFLWGFVNPIHEQAIKKLAAELYGCGILKRSIEDDRRNFTRFFLVSARRRSGSNAG